MQMCHVICFLFLTLTSPVFAGAAPEWVQRSDENSAILLKVLAKYGPELASRFGVEGHDSDVTTLPLDRNARTIADLEAAIQQLEAKLEAEKDPLVRQDLQILTNSARLQIEGTRLGEKYNLPYFDVPLTVFQGLRALLDERVAAERRPAALVRLRKYAGLEPGTTPLTKQAIAYTRAHLADKGLIGPFKDNLVKDMGNSARYVSGIEELFKQFKITGYEPAFAELKKQVEEYQDFLQSDVMPRVTTDFRLPAELYRFSLRQMGNDMPVEELISRAKTSFREIQNEMNALTPLIAKEKGLKSADYRDLIRELKEAAVCRRRDPPALPGEDEGDRADHRGEPPADAAAAQDEIPHCFRSRDGCHARAPHGHAASHRQHRRAGCVRVASADPFGRWEERYRIRRFHLRCGIVDAQRA